MREKYLIMPRNLKITGHTNAHFLYMPFHRDILLNPVGFGAYYNQIFLHAPDSKRVT